MKLLHSSDWHLGRMLYGRKRYEEFAQFLDWMIATLIDQHIDILVIAGDIFDTTAPSNKAQTLYYDFLKRVSDTGCRHVVIIGGNHDSPTLLNAPKQILRALNIHVIGAATDWEEEVLLLTKPDGTPEALICAVPYLRDRDVRRAELGESLDDKNAALLTGIRSHYQTVADLAEQKRQELDADIPLIGTGHLFAAGGKTEDGDGVRDLYVGSLAAVDATSFPAAMDYVALGHLHVPQRVGGTDRIRYSGSPLPMGFGEARQQKSLCLVEFNGRQGELQLLPIPCFQKLAQISGDWAQIDAAITALAEKDESVWLEVTYEGEELISDLRQRLEDLIDGTALEILRTKNTRVFKAALERFNATESLEELSEADVFDRCLAQNELTETDQAELKACYAEVLTALHEADSQAD